MESALEAVTAARDDLLAAGTARFRLSFRASWADVPRPRHRLVRAGLWLASRVVPSGVTGEGVVDFARRRYMADFENYAGVFEDGVMRGGMSGTALGEPDRDEKDSDDDRGDTLLSPLWMTDLLAGVVEATDAEGAVGAYRRIEVKVDLGRAADASPGFALPSVAGNENWRARPAGVWLAGGRLSRVEFEQDTNDQALELFDLGVDLGGVDWDRLPQRGAPLP